MTVRHRSDVPAPAPPPDLQAINPDVFYNESETAYFARMRTPKTLTVWRARGEHPELKFTKAYGRVLYKGSDIIAFLDGTAKAPETAKRQKGGAK
jgi:hypothetical protein